MKIDKFLELILKEDKKDLDYDKLKEKQKLIERNKLYDVLVNRLRLIFETFPKTKYARVPLLDEDLCEETSSESANTVQDKDANGEQNLNESKDADIMPNDVISEESTTKEAWDGDIFLYQLKALVLYWYWLKNYKQNYVENGAWKNDSVFCVLFDIAVLPARNHEDFDLEEKNMPNWFWITKPVGKRKLRLTKVLMAEIDLCFDELNDEYKSCITNLSTWGAFKDNDEKFELPSVFREMIAWFKNIYQVDQNVKQLYRRIVEVFNLITTTKSKEVMEARAHKERTLEILSVAEQVFLRFLLNVTPQFQDSQQGDQNVTVDLLHRLSLGFWEEISLENRKTLINCHLKKLMDEGTINRYLRCNEVGEMNESIRLIQLKILLPDVYRMSGQLLERYSYLIHHAYLRIEQENFECGKMHIWDPYGKEKSDTWDFSKLEKDIASVYNKLFSNIKDLEVGEKLFVEQLQEVYLWKLKNIRPSW